MEKEWFMNYTEQELEFFIDRLSFNLTFTSGDKVLMKELLLGFIRDLEKDIEKDLINNNKCK